MRARRMPHGRHPPLAMSSVWQQHSDSATADWPLASGACAANLLACTPALLLPGCDATESGA
jgi:hypothetical protein